MKKRAPSRKAVERPDFVPPAAPRERFPKGPFVRALAEYLAGDAARMSVALQLRDPAALQWSRLRSTTPLFGWQSIDEAEKMLGEWLGAVHG